MNEKQTERFSSEIIIMLIGAFAGFALVMVGTLRHDAARGFTPSYMAMVGLAMVAAVILLFVLAYVAQHAMLAAIMPIAVIGILIARSSIFDLAFGIDLLGIILNSMWSKRSSG